MAKPRLEEKEFLTNGGDAAIKKAKEIIKEEKSKKVKKYKKNGGSKEDFLREAAKIEGATGWEIFWKVTFPNVSPIILVNIIYTIIDSITDANNELMSYINSTAFSQLIYSRACLEAWIFFIILLVIVGVIFLIGNKVVFYQTDR